MKTIDMTPTWEGVLPVLIMTLQRSKVDPDSLETAQTELTKMGPEQILQPMTNYKLKNVHDP